MTNYTAVFFLPPLSSTSDIRTPLSSKSDASTAQDHGSQLL
jgi:hypothetical protein